MGAVALLPKHGCGHPRIPILTARGSRPARRSPRPLLYPAGRHADACGMPAQVLDKLKSDRGSAWGMTTWVRNRAGLVSALASRESVASHSTVRPPPPTPARGCESVSARLLHANPCQYGSWVRACIMWCDVMVAVRGPCNYVWGLRWPRLQGQHMHHKQAPHICGRHVAESAVELR